MAPAHKKIEAEALKFPARARLAQSLIASLERPPDPDSERLRLGEIERRATELATGKITAVPAEEVFKKKRSRLH